VTALIMPLLTCLCLHYGVGGKMSGLKIGVFNEDTSYFNECLNLGHQPVMKKTLEPCIVEQASCRFLNAMDPDIGKVF
jgi:hypothetical protein